MIQRLALATLLLAAIPLTAQAQTAERFNLNCKIEAAYWEFEGDRKEMPLDTKTVHEPFTLRVDLAAKSWCRITHCRDVTALTYDANEISFTQARIGLFTPKDFIIRRRTGEFVKADYVRDDASGPVSIVKGRCTPAPFTPFPKAMF
jgi:hypothetical protein